MNVTFRKHENHRGNNNVTPFLIACPLLITLRVVFSIWPTFTEHLSAYPRLPPVANPLLVFTIHNIERKHTSLTRVAIPSSPWNATGLK